MTMCTTSVRGAIAWVKSSFDRIFTTLVTCQAMMPATIPILHVQTNVVSAWTQLATWLLHGSHSSLNWLAQDQDKMTGSHDEDGDEQAAHKLARLLLDFLQDSTAGRSGPILGYPEARISTRR